MNKIISIITITITTLSSCSLQKGYVLLEQEMKNEKIGIDVVKNYIKINPRTSFVVTAPNSKEKSTESDRNAYIYNVIEKELLQAGFDVKDRGLYNEVVSKSKDINYSDLKKLTGTDIILELVKIDNDVTYYTNKWYKKSGIPMIYKYGEFVLKGSKIEFKFTLIDGNRYAGSYTFNYVPCKEKRNDCRCEVAYKNAPSKVYPLLSFCRGNTSDNSKAYEFVSKDEMEEFVKFNVRRMIDDIKGQ